MPSSDSWTHASEVTRREEHNFDGHLATGWDILGATNGGYVLAIVAKAMAASGGRTAPASVTGHFLSPSPAGDFQITTDVVKTGRRLATVRGTARREGKLLVEAIGAFGDFAAPSPMQLQNGQPPEIPPPDECVRLRSAAATWEGSPEEIPPLPPPFMDRIELRLHPEDASFMLGNPSGEAKMRAWFRLLNDEPIDPFALIVAADCLPPTTFNAGLPIAWTPTVELTVHVRAKPAPGWLQLDYHSRFVGVDRLEVDGLIWDQNGNLVTQSRQLALVPQT